MSSETQSDPKSPWLALLSVGLGMFIVIVDVTILNIAMPALAADLDADMPELEWAMIGYSLTMIGLVPIFGRISDVLGRKRIYVIGILIFTAASALAAAAPVIEALIAARVLQAIGGASITSNALAILTDVFPPGKRGVAMGIQAIIISGGAAVGPVLGGFLVSGFGWPAVFLVNVPIGLGSAALASWVLPPLIENRVRERLDWLGAGLLLGGLVGSLTALTRAPEWGFADPRTLTALAIGLPLLAAFVVRQRRASEPLVKPALFRIRAFVTGQVAGLFATMTLVAMIFLLPFYWQTLRGYEAREAGLLMLPIPLTLMVIAPISGRLSDRIGSRGLTTAGLLVSAMGALALSTVDAESAVPLVLLRCVLLGLGLGLFFAPNNSATMSAVPASDRGIASGLLALSRYIGQALGFAVGGTLFLHAAGHAGGVELITPEGLASVEGAARTALQEDFVTGFRAVCLAVIPVALVGAALSFARGPLVVREEPA